QIHGVRTNRELLVRTLEHPEFLRGQTDTHFLARHDAVTLGAPLGDLKVQRWHAAAAALTAQAARRCEAQVLAAIPSGWRNNPSQFQQARFRADATEIVVEYRFERDGLLLRIDGEDQTGAHLAAVAREQIRLVLEGVERVYDVHRHADTFYVDSALGSSVLVEVPRFPIRQQEAAAGSLRAPLAGVVNEVRVKKGDAVAAGDIVLVIDSMKVFHWISAPLSGRIAEIRVEPGAHVEGGTVLAVIEDSA
ncbi:MAG TPA: biotin/lipoyl-containing protein, partial [Pirellulales bacterium]|nr:biotin/lipoyl-containing protein [Pirellulales bacterium]